VKHKQASKKIMYEKRIIFILFTIYLAQPKEHYCKNYRVLSSLPVRLT